MGSYSATLTLKKQHSELIEEYDDMSEHDQDGDLVCFEFHDCKYTNVEYLLGEETISRLNNAKAEFDIETFGGDGLIGTDYYRFNDDGERSRKTVKVEEASISIKELLSAIESGQIEALVKSRAESVLVEEIKQ